MLFYKIKIYRNVLCLIVCLGFGFFIIKIILFFDIILVLDNFIVVVNKYYIKEMEIVVYNVKVGNILKWIFKMLKWL